MRLRVRVRDPRASPLGTELVYLYFTTKRCLSVRPSVCHGRIFGMDKVRTDQKNTLSNELPFVSRDSRAAARTGPSPEGMEEASRGTGRERGSSYRSFVRSVLLLFCAVFLATVQKKPTRADGHLRDLRSAEGRATERARACERPAIRVRQLTGEG